MWEPSKGMRGEEEGRKERKVGDGKSVVTGGLIYGGFPFNEIVSVTEPVKGP